MAKQLLDLGKLCEALGVDRPNEVCRVVVDIRSGHVPTLYVERIGDTEKIVAALSEPGIELRRDDPGAAVLHARNSVYRCVEPGGQATNDAEATCPKCRALINLKVEFCSWCPVPALPTPKYHPDGGPAHRE